jgi:lycopene cyclase domain-containing protein
MAFTYLILNVVFILAIVFLFVKKLTKPSKAWWITLATLLVLTLIFDNLIIYFGMVGYTPELILGFRIGFAPIEDFFYSLLACILVPLLWQRFAPANEKRGVK